VAHKDVIGAFAFGVQDHFFEAEAIFRSFILLISSAFVVEAKIADPIFIEFDSRKGIRQNTLITYLLRQFDTLLSVGPGHIQFSIIVAEPNAELKSRYGNAADRSQLRILRLVHEIQRRHSQDGGGIVLGLEISEGPTDLSFS
jgi:hypothetical protein